MGVKGISVNQKRRVTLQSAVFINYVNYTTAERSVHLHSDRGFQKMWHAVTGPPALRLLCPLCVSALESGFRQVT